MTLHPVAYYSGPFRSKFGIPRQSSLSEVPGRIVFCPSYKSREAVRGLDGFDRIWLIWGFSANRGNGEGWSPTVRPPRLGGNVKIGIWATRSPYRPNPLGLSCVELVAVEDGQLLVKGADLMDGTPVYDIKPYLVYADSFPGARQAYVDGPPEKKLEVCFPEGFPPEDRAVLRDVLSLDPRPSYQEDPNRVYGMPYRGKDLKFNVKEGVLTVLQWE